MSADKRNKNFNVVLGAILLGVRGYPSGIRSYPLGGKDYPSHVMGYTLRVRDHPLA